MKPHCVYDKGNNFSYYTKSKTGGSNMNPKMQAYEKTAKTIIGWLNRRNMDGYYFATSKEAVEAILNEIPDGSKVTWAGTMTFLESGMKAALENGNYELIDRDIVKTPFYATALATSSYSLA